VTAWRSVRDGDPVGLALYERHYSARRYQDGRSRRLFVGPGEKLVLVTDDRRALFVWRRFRSRDDQTGVNCAVFRNEGAGRSSDLIVEAMSIAWRRWPGARLYTYVDPTAIRSSNPGYCFLRAGWTRVGTTAGGHGRRRLVILAAAPRDPSRPSTHVERRPAPA
jgi:hypothetical protein